MVEDELMEALAAEDVAVEEPMVVQAAKEKSFFLNLRILFFPFLFCFT